MGERGWMEIYFGEVIFWMNGGGWTFVIGGWRLGDILLRYLRISEGIFFGHFLPVCVGWWGYILGGRSGKTIFLGDWGLLWGDLSYILGGWSLALV